MEPGRRIEHYVVIEKIGQGGQAAVWSAYDERLKRTVAIKTIGLSQFEAGNSTTEGASAFTTPDRFREEAQIIAALEHPNILPVYAFGQEEDWLYIVMRYMAAGSLKDLLKHEPISPERALTLMEPLAGALDLAHQSKIIHRDLKSANVLLDAHLHPYLADFGLSMTIGDKNSVAGVGTLAYMSPEQMMGDPLDHRSDLYSFGILLFELLTCQLPNVNGQPWNLQQVMAAAPLPIPESMPPTIAEVLRKATALEAKDRYQTATEMIDALRDAVQPAGKTQVNQPAPVTDPAMLAVIEAHDLFDKALERWSDGAGRFRLEAGDFKYIDSFFSAPEDWNIYLNDDARRLMLRAALEHGYNVDTWWSQLDNLADRRAVTLQTLTSDLAPARLRAIERLTAIEDSEPPAIPIRVANVIDVEPDPAVRIAGITLLEDRATPSKGWRPTAYSEFIDGVLARLAAEDSDPQVAEAAARACARIRSTLAVSRLAERAKKGEARAVQALTSVRDEVPALPSSVSPDLRLRVFAALSWRQFFTNPLSLIARYASASLGFAVALGAIVYYAFNDANGLLAAQRLGNAMAVGALYGLLGGLGTFAATELAGRLRAWNRLGRIALGLVVGAVFTLGAFIVFHNNFYFNTPASSDVQWLLAESAVLIAGFAISSAFTRRASIRSAAGAIGVLIAVFYISLQVATYPLILSFTDMPDDVVLYLSIFMALAIGLLTFLPEWIGMFRRFTAKLPQ